MTSKDRSAPPQFFGLDLNCAIYHCVKKVQRVTPYTPENRSKWEDALIASVISYIKQMREIVKPTETLYVAVDGVAPMAKIKQQRMRRFKSAAAAHTEARIKAEADGLVYEPQPRWDTNAITPGTQFMTNLATALRAYAKTDTKVIVSPADIPGEGEQKLVEYLREHKPSDAVIYGLDADLIVLALWTSHTQSTNIDLFREDVEFGGGIKENMFGDEEYLYLNIQHLAAAVYNQYTAAPPPTLTQPTRQQFIQDFVGLMNLLGNDFVPHGMGLKIRAGGIQMLLERYMTLPRPIVRQSETQWEYNPEAIKAYFSWFNTQEPEMILEGIKKKFWARVGSTPSRDPADQALARYNDSPVEWKAEKDMVFYARTPGSSEPQLQLKHNWRQVYETQALWGADPTLCVKTYLESLSWTLAYYSGASIDMHWYYPWLLPPLTNRVLDYLSTNQIPQAPSTKHQQVTPTQQLAMVLPETSFHLLPKELQTLPKMYPHAFPCDWAYYSFGRRFMWECEPLIPLIQPNQIKHWVEIAYDN